MATAGGAGFIRVYPIFFIFLFVRFSCGPCRHTVFSLYTAILLIAVFQLEALLIVPLLMGPNFVLLIVPPSPFFCGVRWASGKNRHSSIASMYTRYGTVPGYQVLYITRVRMQMDVYIARYRQVRSNAILFLNLPLGFGCHTRL